MGVWSAYDDGSDRVADLIIELEQQLLPKSLKQLPTDIERPGSGSGANIINKEFMMYN